MSVWSQILFQESASPIMQLLSLFHDYTLSIIVFIVIFVMGVSLSMISNRFISDFPVVTMVEVVWTVVPIIILFMVVVPSLQILYFMEENDSYLTLKVTGHQWYWSYELADVDLEFDSYMLGSHQLGEYRLLDVDHRVVLPINKELRALITSGDVLHCWSLPSLSVKADAVPGRLNQVYFNILRSSLIYGQCSEICGANHSFMPISVEGLSLGQFLGWCNADTPDVLDFSSVGSPSMGGSVHSTGSKWFSLKTPNRWLVLIALLAVCFLDWLVIN